MDQELFWIISAFNFICILILTVVNISVSRKTSFQINNISKKNLFEMESHYKMIMQFASFLSAIDEGYVTIPQAKMVTILINDSVRDKTMDDLLHAKTEVETAYYKLLMMLSYAKEDTSIIENNINAVMLLYRNMYNCLFVGLTEKCLYHSAGGENKSELAETNISSTNNLANYNAIRTSFIEQKNILSDALRQYVKSEISSFYR